jgi:hypothetical protein
MLLQYNENRVLRLCAYFLRKNTLAKYNYEIYNKELLAII